MRYFSKNRLVFQNSGTPLGIMLPLTMDKQKKEGIADDELISLGVVGGHISENLIDSGYVLIVYNRIKTWNLFTRRCVFPDEEETNQQGGESIVQKNC